jgi:hypothetical protein
MEKARVAILKYQRHGGMSGYHDWESRGYCEKVQGIVKDLDIIFTSQNVYSITSFFVNDQKYEIWGENGLHLGLHIMEGDEVILHLSKLKRAVAIEIIREDKVVRRMILEQGRESNNSNWYRFED